MFNVVLGNSAIYLARYRAVFYVLIGLSFRRVSAAITFGDPIFPPADGHEHVER